MKGFFVVLPPFLLSSYIYKAFFAARAPNLDNFFARVEIHAERVEQ